VVGSSQIDIKDNIEPVNDLQSTTEKLKEVISNSQNESNQDLKSPDSLEALKIEEINLKHNKNLETVSDSKENDETSKEKSEKLEMSRNLNKMVEFDNDDETVSSHRFEKRLKINTKSTVDHISIKSRTKGSDSFKNSHNELCSTCKHLNSSITSEKSLECVDCACGEKITHSLLKNELRHIRTVVYKRDRRPVVKWTDEEVEWLLDGVEKKYSWAKIQKEYPFTRRTPVDLKDKYRLIKKRTSYYTNNKKEYVLLGENNEIVLDATGYVRTYKTRFPIEAAHRMALDLDIRDGEIIKVAARDKMNIVYFYKVCLDQDYNIKILSIKIKNFDLVISKDVLEK
ncbi:hypothetical protein EDEG_01908, partial [Edhazardia aedis USNM 41457]